MAPTHDRGGGARTRSSRDLPRARRSGRVADGAALVWATGRAGRVRRGGRPRVGRGDRCDPPARVPRAARPPRWPSTPRTGRSSRRATCTRRRTSRAPTSRRAHTAARVRRIDARRLRRAKSAISRLPRGPRRSPARRRPGLIAGAGDASGRSGYWSRGPRATTGRRSVPDILDAAVQAIHVDDLVRFTLDAIEQGRTGALNAVGDRSRSWTGSRRREPRPGTRARSWPCRRVARRAGRRGVVGPRLAAAVDHRPHVERLPGSFERGRESGGAAAAPLDRLLAETLEWERSMGLDRERGAGLSPRRSASCSQRCAADLSRLRG